jgi:plasmid maintenance system antidote protein VapI
MSGQFWLNLQAHYDLEMEEERLGKRLEREVKVLAVAGRRSWGRAADF